MTAKEFRDKIKSGQLEIKNGRIKTGEMLPEWEAHLKNKDMTVTEYRKASKSHGASKGSKSKKKSDKTKVIEELEFCLTRQNKNTFTLMSPISVMVGKKKIALNLNIYRNLHYRTSNKAKIEYKRVMANQVQQLPKFNKIKLEFVLHKNSKRKIDRHNICSIVQKFSCDALVEMGKLIDDNDTFIDSELYRTGDNVKGMPYCEIKITSL